MTFYKYCTFRFAYIIMDWCYDMLPIKIQIYKALRKLFKKFEGYRRSVYFNSIAGQQPT